MKNDTDSYKDLSKLKGKSILLCMPNYFNIYELFAENIKALGMELILIVPPVFYYKRWKDRVINFLRKVFLGDRQYKNKLIKQFNIEYFLNKTSNIESKSIDYMLFVQPDLVTDNQIGKLLRIGKKNIAYHWNGLEQYPDMEVFDNIGQFDTFYVFDPKDYQKYREIYPNIKLSHNFFFENIENTTTVDNIEKKALYVGSYFEDRIKNVIFVEKLLDKYNIPTDIELVYKDKKPFLSNKNIKITSEKINFIDYLKKVQRSKILLDFKLGHNGLSFRFFEALKYEKKIITDNFSVKEYDFYNPNNIFILHKDNLENLETFLHSDYQKLPPELVEKYSFSSWIYDCLCG